MPAIKNVSPYGALDVPLLRRVVDAGETVDVSDAEAEVLLAQADNFAPADAAAQTVADRLHRRAVSEERDALGMPAVGALKAEWVAYAQAQGDPDPEAKTKEQLVAEYGAVPSEEQP